MLRNCNQHLVRLRAIVALSRLSEISLAWLLAQLRRSQHVKWKPGAHEQFAVELATCINQSLEIAARAELVLAY